MTITDEHLEIIDKYALFRRLIDSNGIIDESVLEKLKMNVRAIMEANKESGDLVMLCQDVLFHDNMKAYGLTQLVKLFVKWTETRNE